MNKAESVKQLEDEIGRDETLPLFGQANLVFGEGNIDCSVMFIGEAPGENEDRLRRPFVGRGGQLLDKMIEGIGWHRADVYITNIVKRRPPGNRDPLPEEIAAYKPYLTRQIELINPKVVVTLGRFSMNYFLPEAKISRDRGHIFMIDGRIIFPVFHPAAALRSPDMMRGFEEDIKKLPDVFSGKFINNIITVPAMKADVDAPKADAKKQEKSRQQGLF
jgi:uracil-DNA glycosylase family 4